MDWQWCYRQCTKRHFEHQKSGKLGWCICRSLAAAGRGIRDVRIQSSWNMAFDHQCRLIEKFSWRRFTGREQGPVGAAGTTGLTGPTGATGPAGPQGEPGMGVDTAIMCQLFTASNLVAPASLGCSTSQDKTVFVTAQTLRGNFGGSVAADKYCQVEATSAGLTGVYRALLSDEFNYYQTRLNFPNTARYLTANGTVVATSPSQILQSNTSLNAPINRLATGSLASGTGVVWTGGNAGSPSDCRSWGELQNGPLTRLGYYGIMSTTGTSWQRSNSTSCATQARLYCFEQ